MSDAALFFGRLAARNAAETEWSPPLSPAGCSEDLPYSPLKMTTRSRKGSSGFVISENSKFVPVVAGLQYPGAAPCGTKIPVKRVRTFAAVWRDGVCAG